MAVSDLSDEDRELLAKLVEAVGPLGMEPRGVGKGDAHCPSWPRDHQAGDFGYLPVIHDAYPFGFDVTGWTRIGTEPTEREGTSITMFYRFAMSAHECDPMIQLTGVDTWGRIYTFTRIATQLEPLSEVMHAILIEPLRDPVPSMVDDRLITIERWTGTPCSTCGAPYASDGSHHAADCPLGIYLRRREHDEAWQHMTPKQKLEEIRAWRPERAP